MFQCTLTPADFAANENNNTIPWILAAGAWNDNGQWIDSETWDDGE